MLEGDILLFNTNDGGEIEIMDGLFVLTGGFETAAYISLFGGNNQDDGTQNNQETYWGNYLNELSLISETQYLLNNIAPSANNLIRIEDAVKNDLQWFIDQNIATTVLVEITIPDYNRVKIDISIEALGDVSQFAFIENWSAQKENGA